MILLSILFPIFSCVLAYALLGNRLCQSAPEKKLWLRHLALVGGGEILFFLLLQGFLSLFMQTDKFFVLPALGVCVVSFLTTAGFLCSKRQTLWASTFPRLSRFFKHAAIAAIVLFVTESLVFQYQSYGAEKRVMDLPLSTAVNDSGVPYTPESDGALRLSNNDTLTFTLEQPAEDFHNLKVYFRTQDPFFRIALSGTDENSSQTDISLARKCTNGTIGELSFYFDQFDTIHTLTLQITDLQGTVELTSVQASQAAPFAFSHLRFWPLLLGLLLLLAIREFALWRIPWKPGSHAQTVGVLVLMLACLFSTLLLRDPDQKPREYLEDTTPGNIAEYMFDAFYHGQVSLDIEPDPALTALENPYDRSNREGLNVRWDYAFYQGKYYSYFGTVPVLVVYFPYYFATGMLPSMNQACVFFAVLAVLGIFLALTQCIRLFCKKPSYLLVLLSLLCATLTTNLFLYASFSDMYCLPLVAALAFLFLTIGTGIAAYRAKPGVGRCLLYAGAAVCMVLCVGSRPTTALCSLVLAPLLLHALYKKSEPLRQRLVPLVCCAVPLCAGAIGIMCYNAARFGSPLDFGAAYQLTVSNIHANHLSLRSFPFAVFHYFCQMPDVAGEWPFWRSHFFHFANYGHYVYVEGIYGMLWNPLVLVGVAGFPVLWKRMKRDWPRRSFFLICLLLPVLMCWVTFCVGGVNIRYLADLLPLLCILGVLVVLELNTLAQETWQAGAALVCKGSLVVLGLGILLSIALFLSYDSGACFAVHSDLYCKLQDAIFFLS